MKNEGGRVKREAGRAGGTAGRVGNYEVTNVVPSPSRGGLERGWGPLASRLIHRQPLLCTPSPCPPPFTREPQTPAAPRRISTRRAAMSAGGYGASRSISQRPPSDRY